MRDFLPTPVSIKTKDFAKFPKTSQIFHAESGAQKNPRRTKCQTGINANKSKLKYGAFSFPSTMLIFQTGSKQAENGAFFFPKR